MASEGAQAEQEGLDADVEIMGTVETVDITSEEKLKVCTVTILLCIYRLSSSRRRTSVMERAGSETGGSVLPYVTSRGQSTIRGHISQHPRFKH